MDNAALGGYAPGSFGVDASPDGRGGARDRRRVVLLVADSAWLAGPSGEVSGSACAIYPRRCPERVARDFHLREQSMGARPAATGPRLWVRADPLQTPGQTTDHCRKIRVNAPPGKHPRTSHPSPQHFIHHDCISFHYCARILSQVPFFRPNPPQFANQQITATPSAMIFRLALFIAILIGVCHAATRSGDGTAYSGTNQVRWEFPLTDGQ